MGKWTTAELLDEFLKPEPERPGFDGFRLVPTTFPQEASLSVAVERIDLAGMPIVHRGHVFFVDAEGALCMVAVANVETADEKVAEAHARRTQELRSMPYRKYLQTREWWWKRLDAMNRDSFACRLCGATERLQVHHRTYANRGDELLDDLTTLCSGCHQSFHENGGLARPQS